MFHLITASNRACGIDGKIVSKATDRPVLGKDLRT